MKDRKVKTALKVVHRNDRAQIKRVLAASGQALLPMLELLEGAKASIDELMHDSARGRLRSPGDRYQQTCSFPGASSRCCLTRLVANPTMPRPARSSAYVSGSGIATATATGSP